MFFLDLWRTANPTSCSPTPFGADQLNGAFDPTAFLTVLGCSFHLTCADAAGLVSLHHFGPVGANRIHIFCSTADQRVGDIKAQPKVSHVPFQLIYEDENLSAAARSKTNLGGYGRALAIPGVACLTTLDLEKTRAFLQNPRRSVAALDRAPQVLKPRSRFDHEHLIGKHSQYAVVWCDF